MHTAAAVASVAVAVAVRGYVAICVVFGALGSLLRHQLGGVTRWDDDVVRWFAAHRSAPLNHLTDYATKVADTFGILIVVLVATVVLFMLQHRWDALFLVIALCLAAHHWLDWLRVLGRVISRAPNKSPMVKMTQGRKFSVRLDTDLPYELDGSARPKTNKLRVRMERAAVCVCVPQLLPDGSRLDS